LSGISVATAPPDAPEVRRLFEASDRYLLGLYDADQAYLTSPDDLSAGNAIVFLAFREDVAVGCGVLLAQPGYGEIKRVYVDEAARGLGAGRQIVAHIERAAAAAGVGRVRLETGIRQPEAFALYRSCGYVEIGAFGDYKPDPVSVFMEKRL